METKKGCKENTYRLVQDGIEIMKIEASHAEGALDRLMEMGYDLFANTTLQLEPVVNSSNYQDEWDNWHPHFF